MNATKNNFRGKLSFEALERRAMLSAIGVASDRLAPNRPTDFMGPAAYGETIFQSNNVFQSGAVPISTAAAAGGQTESLGLQEDVAAANQLDAFSNEIQSAAGALGGAALGGIQQDLQALAAGLSENPTGAAALPVDVDVVAIMAGLNANASLGVVGTAQNIEGTLTGLANDLQPIQGVPASPGSGVFDLGDDLGTAARNALQNVDAAISASSAANQPSGNGLVNPAAMDEVVSPVVTDEVANLVVTDEVVNPVAVDGLLNPFVTNEAPSPFAANEVPSPLAANEVLNPIVTNEVVNPVAPNEVPNPFTANEAVNAFVTNQVVNPVATNQIVNLVTGSQTANVLATNQLVNALAANQSVNPFSTNELVNSAAANELQAYDQTISTTDAVDNVPNPVVAPVDEFAGALGGF
jgi:hypothetical protein